MGWIGPRCGLCQKRGCPGHTTRKHWTDGAGRDVNGTVPRPRR